MATRGELEAEILVAEQIASTAKEPAVRARHQLGAAKARARLQNGDFRVGDRVYVRVLSDSTLAETLTVSPGPTLRIGTLTTVPLTGVLRSELQDRVTHELGKYLRTPEARVVTMMQLAVTGEAARPGFYSLPFESLLADAVMAAGGPSVAGDLRHTVIRRGGDVVISEREVQTAIADARTLDQLDLRAGDEIVIPPRKRTNWSLILGVMGTLSGLATLAVALRSH